MRFAPDSYFRISNWTYEQIENWIRAAEMSGKNVRYGMDALTMLLARTNQAFAMEMARGPLDPRQTHPQWAWRTPQAGIRRITSRYYRGWKVKRLAPGVWMLFNNSREAYYIEFGINWVGMNTRIITYRDGRTFIRHPRRIRRPVQKLSLMKTMVWVQQTKAAERVWGDIFAPFHPGHVYGFRPGHFTGSPLLNYSQMGMQR